MPAVAVGCESEGICGTGLSLERAYKKVVIGVFVGRLIVCCFTGNVDIPESAVIVCIDYRVL